MKLVGGLVLAGIVVLVFSILFLGKDFGRKSEGLVEFVGTNLFVGKPFGYSSLIPPVLTSTDKIFQQDHNWVATLAAEKTISLIVTGDVIPARVVNYKAIDVYKNPNWPWEKTADILRQADITYINLEAPLLSNCPSTREGMVFCGDKQMVNGLVFAGVDAANLANNHTGNYGTNGIDETRLILQQNGILPIGPVGASFLTVKGVKFGFLGYNDIPGSGPVGDEVEVSRMEREIKEAKEVSSVVIVQFHWGSEYKREVEARQRELAQIAIDSGADLIIGNHPHWIKPIEFYRGKLITYGHGNFIFDQEWSAETKEGVVGRYTFYGKSLVDVEYLPIKIIDYGQPYFLTGEEKELVLEKLR